ILFANVGGYQAGTEDSYWYNQAFLNMDGTFVDKSFEVFGPDANDPDSPSLDTGRVIKAYDFDGDGNLDIFVGTTWSTTSRLYMGEGGGVFTEVSETNLPQTLHSIGDAEIADVDGDGDFDIMITDWGDAPVGQVNSPGGVTRLWLNDGGGVFTDVTEDAMPQINVNWSWELEFIDVDNDWDVDVLISCRSCAGGGFLFENNGGTFVNATPGNLPQKVGSVDYEVMDLNGDDYVDVVTLGDGDGGGEGFRNRVLINNKNGGFTDESADYWPPLENSPSYDYMGAFLDPNSDRKPDLIVGAFSDWPNRLMTFSGTSFSGDPDPWPLVNTDGTYALAVADVNNDTKIDVVMAEGENLFRNRVFLASDIAVDTAKPVIQNHVFEGMWTIGETINIHARIHDNKSPNKDHDWTEVVFEYALNDDDIEVNAMTAPLAWYGEYLWRGDFEVPNADKIKYRICAEDAAHNRECTPVQETMIEDPNETESATESMTDSNTDSMTVTDSNTDSMTATDSMTDSASASASASATA
ncbi:MAG: VCBS repeat-containing protein, partial [Ilumatobacter sp.]|nr:VCBS repeat-containing protein [Ilumatobacter sp.]